MNATEYLEQVKTIDTLIENLRCERKRWTEIAESMGAAFSTDEKVKSTHNPQKNANAIITYCDIDREIAELEHKRHSIIQTISRLPSDECSVIYKLFVLYKEYETIKDVAYEKHKSYDWVKKCKRKALRHLQELLDAE